MMRSIRRLAAAALLAVVLSGAVIGSVAAAPPNGTVWNTSNSNPINHWATVSHYYACAPGQHIGDPNRPWDIPFINLSSSGVSATLADGGYGSDRIVVSFTDWNWWGDQTFRVAYVCH
jgi:hypothetical protein